MSAANPANAQAVRRPVAPTRPATTPVSRATEPTASVHAGFDEDTHEFRLNLSDIPRMRESLIVDGLKPTLLSRLFDLIAPIKA